MLGEVILLELIDVYKRQVAHRAGGLVAPENSLKALNLTYKSGIAQMIEVDVQLTKDNKVILLHDSTFERTLGINKRPEDMCYEDIIKYSMIRCV